MLDKNQIEMLPMMMMEIRSLLPTAGAKTKPFITLLDEVFETVIAQQKLIEELEEALEISAGKPSYIEDAE